MGPYRVLLHFSWALLHALVLLSLPPLRGLLPPLLTLGSTAESGSAAAGGYHLVDASVATTCDELSLAISKNESDIVIGASFECAKEVMVVQKTSLIRVRGDGEIRTLSSAPGQRLFNVIYAVNFIIEDVVIAGDTSIGSVDLSYGGMLSFMYSSFTLTRVTVYNSTSDIGGAVFAASSVVNITASKFFGNSATQNGGAVAMVRCSGGIYGTKFESNRALEAGAVFVSSSDSIDIHNSSFYMNGAGSRGGSLIVTSSGVSISDVTVTNSSVPTASTYEGGAMYAESSIIDLRQTDFTNITGSDGFFLYLVSCDATLQDVTFQFGGGVDGIVVVGANSQLIMNFVRITGSRSVGTPGVMCSRGAVCMISNSLFDSNVGSTGSILSFDAALKSSVSTSIFENNVIDADGIISAIYTTYEFNVSSCVFLNNSARNTGGAIHVANALSVYIDDCYFYSNIAGTGGAIQAEFRSVVSITRSFFISNVALDAGGAISVSDNCRVALRNVTLQFNNASNGGALSVQFVSTVTMVDVIMQYDAAEFRGGGMYITGYSVVNALHLEASDNVAKYGGVISLATGSNLFIQESSFTSNTAVYSGGAMYMVDFCTATIDMSKFRANVCPYMGGALSGTFIRLFVSSSEFIKNRAVESGGALSGELGFYAFNNVTARDNFASNGAFAKMITGSTLIFNQSVFTNHMSAYGMVMLGEYTSWTALDCSFYNNTAVYENGVFFGADFLFVLVRGSYFDGNRASINAVGALLRDTNQTVIENSHFYNNRAKFYGGIFMQSIDLRMESCVFSRNSASGSGGALMLVGGGTLDTLTNNATFQMDIINSTFEGNAVSAGGEVELNVESVSRGGAIYAGEVDVLNIINSTFRDNAAYFGGAIYSIRSHVSIEGSSFQSNWAKYGGGGVYWSVDKGFQNSEVLLCNSTKAISHGNMAGYGNLAATDVYKLDVVEYPSVIGSGEATRQFTVETQDFYGQVVTKNEGSGTQLYMFSGTSDSISTLQGKTVVAVDKGVANFTSLIFTLAPKQVIGVQFDFENINTTVFVPMRACGVGEELRTVGASDSGLSVCSICDDGTFPIPVTVDGKTEYQCIGCPENAECQDNRVIVDQGYWRTTNISRFVLKCPFPKSCKGGYDVNDLCVDGYSGAYCSICDYGYSKTSDGSCIKCHSSSKIVTPVILILTFAAVFSALCYVFVKWESIRVYIHKMIVRLAQKAEEYKLNSLRTKIKIMITFVQVLTLMPSVLVSIFPDRYLNVIRGLNFVQLDFLDIFDFGCMFDSNFHMRLLAATLGPFILFGLAFLILLIKRLVLMNTFNPYRTPQMQKDFITCVIVITFLIFSPTSITIFEAFACEKFDDGSELLIADYSIDCKSPAYRYFAAYAGVMILVYPCGIPAAYYMILTYYHKFVNPSARLVVREEERHLVDKRIIQAEKARLRDTYDEIAHITFLYENYSPRRWYFEVLDCFRRLVLTAIPVLFLRDSILQVVVVLIFSLVWCILYMELRPFAKKNDNTVAIISQWAISFTLLGGIGTRAMQYEQRPKDDAFTVILVIMNIGIIFATIYIAARVPDIDPLQELANDIRDTNKEFETRDSDDSVGAKDDIAGAGEFAPDSDDEDDEEGPNDDEASGSGSAKTKNPMQQKSVDSNGLPVADARSVGSGKVGAPDVKKVNNSYAGSHLFGSMVKPGNHTQSNTNNSGNSSNNSRNFRSGEFHDDFGL